MGSYVSYDKYTCDIEINTKKCTMNIKSKLLPLYKILWIHLLFLISYDIYIKYKLTTKEKVPEFIVSLMQFFYG